MTMIFDSLNLVSVLNGKEEGVTKAYSILWDVEKEILGCEICSCKSGF